MDVLELAEDPLTRLLAGDAPAERVVRDALRAHPELDDDGRRSLAQVLYGVCVHRARLAHGLRAVGAPVDARHHAALYLHLFAEEPPTSAAIERAARAPLPDDPRERLLVERSVPAWLGGALLCALGDDADAFLESVNEPGPVFARANALLTSRAALCERLTEEGHPATPGVLTPWSVRFEGRPNVYGSGAWRDGWFEVQDEGSQVIARATCAAPGETVVDLCAGRGGKTLVLAAMMENRGELHAFDVDTRRLHDLEVRARRAGVTVARAAPLDDGRAPDALAAAADVVLVDAPCSELGTLRRSPDLRWREPPALGELTALQGRILDEGARLVRAGGRLVYATCSVLPAENEEVVRAFLGRHDLFSLLEERTLLPHRDGTDGFYVARLRRLD